MKEQVNPAAQLKPLKFRQAEEFRDIPLPRYVSEAIDKHVAGHGTTPDGYLFQGRKYKLVVRRSYQEDFPRRSQGRAPTCPLTATAQESRGLWLADALSERGDTSRAANRQIGGNIASCRMPLVGMFAQVGAISHAECPPTIS